LEELGTDFESHTEIVNFQLEKDQITALTAGSVQTQIIKENGMGRDIGLRQKSRLKRERVLDIRWVNFHDKSGSIFMITVIPVRKVVSVIFFCSSDILV